MKITQETSERHSFSFWARIDLEDEPLVYQSVNQRKDRRRVRKIKDFEVVTYTFDLQSPVKPEHVEARLGRGTIVNVLKDGSDGKESRERYGLPTYEFPDDVLARLEEVRADLEVQWRSEPPVVVAMPVRMVSEEFDVARIERELKGE